MDPTERTTDYQTNKGTEGDMGVRSELFWSAFFVVASLVGAQPARAQSDLSKSPSAVLRVDPMDLQLPEGRSSQVFAYWWDSGRNQPAQGARWSSSNSKVVRVSSGGTVQAVGKGSARVTVVVGGKKASVNIVVR